MFQEIKSKFVSWLLNGSFYEHRVSILENISEYHTKDITNLLKLEIKKKAEAEKALRLQKEEVKKRGRKPKNA